MTARDAGDAAGQRKSEAVSVQGDTGQSRSVQPTVKPAANQSRNDKWLDAFYKECGREVTLAYTTHNQMKNWAIVVLGGLVAAAASLLKPGWAASAPQSGNAPATASDASLILMGVGVLAYALNVR